MDSADNRLAGLALTWLAPRPHRTGTRAELDKALRPFVEHRLSRAEWKTLLDSVLEHLLQEQLVTRKNKAGLELTSAGLTRVLQFLRLEQLPKGLTWKKLKATYLLANSLELTPSKAVLTRLADADGVRAAVLGRQYPAVSAGDPSLPQLRDRLLWRQLGVDTERPFSLAAVQAHLLGKLLGTEVKDPRKAVEQLTARVAGATRADAEAVRLTLLRKWFLPEQPAVPTVVSTAPTTWDAKPPAPRTEDFADHVLSVARALPTGRFGRDKVFISHVWKALQPEWPHREAFEAALLEANRTQRLSLTRADLVSAMNPTDVAESEVRSYGASFHFVVV
ncbi:hypothetical protein FJV41_06735 [Myxococcus llanfairpwllgwyngyllgogerychwyrndrobwllllantysiliogogogochensis]|uniref:Uncharacterized protein n=1 Tax=Myxococcus llanfairpwllgwyngyllgogerychwyrndrobwllllantysiliogogogochensis TaxID=2590453 RepID=A0A540X619_9BACT|nr:hypothetical protein [Myxococcus llanfairpwllgwyngyllgogerychwyrndrobwllllantysiliogogogochensis]TQF16711.1 hypothetical protein FJV41_06735 [Myxococcus llanfairpwllgwyngyllgogerychwyrndrobwllllantysiliogogogochensis]